MYTRFSLCEPLNYFLHFSNVDNIFNNKELCSINMWSMSGFVVLVVDLSLLNVSAPRLLAVALFRCILRSIQWWQRIYEFNLCSLG